MPPNTGPQERNQNQPPAVRQNAQPPAQPVQPPVQRQERPSPPPQNRQEARPEPQQQNRPEARPSPPPQNRQAENLSLRVVRRRGRHLRRRTGPRRTRLLLLTTRSSRRRTKRRRTTRSPSNGQIVELKAAAIFAQRPFAEGIDYCCPHEKCGFNNVLLFAWSFFWSRQSRVVANRAANFFSKRRGFACSGAS